MECFNVKLCQDTSCPQQSYVGRVFHKAARLQSRAYPPNSKQEMAFMRECSNCKLEYNSLHFYEDYIMIFIYYNIR